MGLVFLPSIWQSTSRAELNPKRLFGGLGLKFWNPPGHKRILKALFWVNELNEEETSSFHIISWTFFTSFSMSFFWRPFHLFPGYFYVSVCFLAISGCFWVFHVLLFPSLFKVGSLTHFQWPSGSATGLVDSCQPPFCWIFPVSWMLRPNWNVNMGLDWISSSARCWAHGTFMDGTRVFPPERSENDGTHESWWIPSQIQHFFETESSL